MSHAMRKEKNALHDNELGRVIPCNKLDWGDPVKWLKLGLNDMFKAPLITLFYGMVFCVIPILITYLVSLTDNYLVVGPAIVAFMMLGPFLAAGLYDVSWEFEKGIHLHCGILFAQFIVIVCMNGHLPYCCWYR